MRIRSTWLSCPDGLEGGGDEADGTPGEAGAPPAETLAATAIARYRALVAAQPGLVPEMVSGNTPDEIDASAEAARQAYSDISRRLAEQYERQVPTGNPPRSATTAAADHLKPEAKIALGLRSAK